MKVVKAYIIKSIIPLLPLSYRGNKKTPKKVAPLWRFIRLCFTSKLSKRYRSYFAGRTAITSISTRHAGFASLAIWNVERAGSCSVFEASKYLE